RHAHSRTQQDDQGRAGRGDPPHLSGRNGEMPEVVVIGGGVMGLAAARELRGRGPSVTLLERAQPGRAASWASAGIIGATMRDESDPSFQLRRVSHELWPA